MNTLNGSGAVNTEQETVEHVTELIRSTDALGEKIADLARARLNHVSMIRTQHRLDVAARIVFIVTMLIIAASMVFR